MRKNISNRGVRSKNRLRSLLAWGFVGIALGVFGPQAVRAQNVEVEPYLGAKSTTCIASVGDVIFAGAETGGLFLMDRANPGVMERWNGGPGLSGNNVTGLAWTGRFLWVATLDNGLTRVDDPTSRTPTFRQYLDNLGSRRVTGVTGRFGGGSELVYYAMQGAGVGRIENGIGGLVYNADQDGLLSNDVNDLQLLGDELFAATDLGVSRLNGNVFVDANDGLTNPWVYDLALDADGNLVAGGKGGVFRWDAQAEAWNFIGGIGSWVVGLAAQEDGPLWALGLDSSQDGVLARAEGGSWVSVAVPFPKTTSIFADRSLWVGGRVLDEGMPNSSGRAFVSRFTDTDAFENYVTDVSLVRNAEGAAFTRDGSAWIGSWLADAISVHDEETGWRHIARRGTAENDFDGLINFGANVLCLTEDAAGNVWAGQFGSGVLKIDPEDLSVEQVRVDDSGLDGALILNLVAHPDGPVLFLHDLDGGMADVLLDPANWDNGQNWLNLPQTGETLGSDAKIWEALVERRDVVWFAVEGRGLVRWDINGDGHGPDDELTWDVPGDDSWSGPFIAFEDTNGFEVSDPRSVRGMALAEDGSIWAGGVGAVRFVYDADAASLTAIEFWEEKTATYDVGLLNGSVVDLALDVNGDVWFATATGLNRLRWRDGTPNFDLWTDLTNYLLYPVYRDLYSPSVVAELPGINYRRLEVDATGTSLLLTSDLGAVRLRVEEGYEESVQPVTGVDQLFVAPNPWSPDAGDGLLKLSGFPADSEETAVVEIYNLEGQLVYRDRSVEPDRGFWRGRNRPGEDVATGMYVVRITWRGETIVRTLAVVR